MMGLTVIEVVFLLLFIAVVILLPLIVITYGQQTGFKDYDEYYSFAKRERDAAYKLLSDYLDELESGMEPIRKIDDPSYKQKVEEFLTQEYGNNYSIEWLDDDRFILSITESVYESDGVTRAGFVSERYPNCTMIFSEYGVKIVAMASEENTQKKKIEIHSWERYKNHPCNRK